MNYENEETRIKKVIETFNKDFRTKIDSNDAHFLAVLYQDFISEYSSSLTNPEIINNIEKIETEITSSFNDEQMKLFNKWNSLQDELYYELMQQAYINGYCTNKQLDYINKMSRD